MSTLEMFGDFIYFPSHSVPSSHFRPPSVCILASVYKEGDNFEASQSVAGFVSLEAKQEAETVQPKVSEQFGVFFCGKGKGVFNFGFFVAFMISTRPSEQSLGQACVGGSNILLQLSSSNIQHAKYIFEKQNLQITILQFS